MKRLILPALLLLMLAVSVTPLVGAATFRPRVPGVSAGAVMVYDVDTGVRSTFTVKVLDVTGNLITDSAAQTDDTGFVYRNDTLGLDVSSLNFQQYPALFIAANLNGGHIFPGSNLIMTGSLFGHIVLGQWRSTNYWDQSQVERSLGFHIPGLVIHSEWDRATGILVSYTNYYNDVGVVMTLKYTNLWIPNVFWFAVEDVLTVGRFIVPIAEIALGTYLVSFFFVAFYDWLRVRRLRQRVSGKTGMGFMYKFIIIAALITAAIFIGVIIVVSFVLGALR